MDAETYGWIAAIIAALSYGTYGVPIKETKIIPIHPFIFQTYKTCTMFICCWFVLLLPNINYSFSYWGILSGLLWVLGGTSGIIAVRYAGMAIAVGTWASVMICVNFIWGILIFHEPVASHTSTAFAFVLLTIGLIGMSKYSETKTKTKTNTKLNNTNTKKLTSTNEEQQVLLNNIKYDEDEDEDTYINNNINEYRAVTHHTRLLAATLGSFQNLSKIGRSHATTSTNNIVDDLAISTIASSNTSTTYGGTDQIIQVQIPTTKNESTTSTCTNEKQNDSNFELVDYDDEDVDEENATSDSDRIQYKYDSFGNNSNCNNNSTSNNDSRLYHNEKNNDYEIITLFTNNNYSWIISHRTIGICGAIANGILTGTSFIPVHYAKSLGFGGAHYMISYAIGALLSNSIIWIVYFVVQLIKCYQTQLKQQTTSINNEIISITLKQLLQNTYNTLPRTYFKQMCLPGFMAGLLLTIAMFGTLIAVTSLGQGVGNSVIQAKILISGMWGIFWYREINDRENIRKWFISASITVVGILWLSYERLEADKINNYYHHSHTSIAHINRHITISNTTTHHI